MVAKEDIDRMLHDYDKDNLAIATVCSHSSLQIFAGAKKEGFKTVGIAIGNLVNLLLPDTVVLGGGLVEAMPELFVTPAHKSANKRTMPSFVDTFDVVPAKLGDDSGVMGAASWVQHVVQGNS